MKKIMNGKTCDGYPLQSTTGIKEVIIEFCSEVRNTFSWTSGNNFATWLMGQLRGDLKQDTHPNVSHQCPREEPTIERVFDIVNAGPMRRYATYAPCGNYEFISRNCLGLQFGMGEDKLATKLTADMGREVTIREAGKLVQLHKKTYSTYWKWSDRQAKIHKRKGALTLWDGWSLLRDNENTLSVKNFPVQGTGAVIMREAVKLAHKKGLQIMAPLHDALYMLAPVDKAEEQAKILENCMLEGVKRVIGDSLEIRLDVDIHKNNETWIEGKGKKYYELLNKYLGNMPTKEDRIQELEETILNGPYK